jgi:hypothetical protein
MSTITYIRATSDGELATLVQDEKRSKRGSASRWVRLEIARAVIAIAAGFVAMAGLLALRLWFLMPASFHFSG